MGRSTGQPPAPADEQVTALRNVVKEPPQLVFRLYTEAEHLSAGGSTPPRAVIDKLDLRVGRRYRFVLHAPDGQQFAVRVAYLEIDCPHRLVKSFVYEGKPEDEAIDTNTPRAGGRGNPGPAAQGSTRGEPGPAVVRPRERRSTGDR